MGLFDSIQESLVDNAVDCAIDKAKYRGQLEKTFVWTAINRETHDGKLANIIFCSKLGQRQRVG